MFPLLISPELQLACFFASQGADINLSAFWIYGGWGMLRNHVSGPTGGPTENAELVLQADDVHVVDVEEVRCT